MQQKTVLFLLENLEFGVSTECASACPGHISSQNQKKEMGFYFISFYFTINIV